jgi:hypothetical protein
VSQNDPEQKPVANDTQVGGAHYKDLPLEPWDLAAIFQLDPYEHEVVAYVLRAPHKNGIEDLKKARHWLDKKIEIERLYLDAQAAEGCVGSAIVRGVAPKSVALALLRAAVAKLERV